MSFFLVKLGVVIKICARRSQTHSVHNHSIVKTRRVKMSDKISDKPVENIPKILDRIVENHKIITVEHELHIKGQVF